MSPAGAGGLTLFAWTDCVALATEAWRLVTSAEPMSIIRRPPGALATAAVINITIKSNDQAITRHRALAAAHLRAVAAEIRERKASASATPAPLGVVDRRSVDEGEDAFARRDAGLVLVEVEAASIHLEHLSRHWCCPSPPHRVRGRRPSASRARSRFRFRLLVAALLEEVKKKRKIH